MCRGNTLLAVVVFLAIVCPCAAQPYEKTDRTLLLDHFDENFVPDGTRCTTPAAITPAGDQTGGRVGKGGEFVPGKFGSALQLHKLMQLQYPAAGNLDLSAGLAEFWVALNFDAAEVIKHPGVLSNQLFLTIGQPGGNHVCVYSTLINTCVGIWDRQRQLVCYGAFPGYWKKHEWHHLELRWGRQLELWCDGHRKVTQDWQGLFGPIDVKPEELRLFSGSHIGYSNVESEFALDEFRILGPGGEQTVDFPTMTIPRIKPPVIDGKIAAGEWDAAAQTTGFVGLSDRILMDAQTIVRAGWDDEALYLCYECFDPQKRPLNARLKQRDSDIFSEDAVDVILQPEAGRYPYYQLATQRDRHPVRRPTGSEERGHQRPALQPGLDRGDFQRARALGGGVQDSIQGIGRARGPEGRRALAGELLPRRRFDEPLFFLGLRGRQLSSHGKLRRANLQPRRSRHPPGAVGRLGHRKNQRPSRTDGLALRPLGDGARKSGRRRCQADPRNRKPPGRLSRGLDQAADARQRPLQPERPRFHGPG